MSVRIAVLADVHGNLPALDAVVADIERAAPDEVLVGGDLVGRGPQGGAVIERIRERSWPSVLGNHEEYLTSFRRREVPDEWLESQDWDASRWMANELNEAQAAYIAALPFSLRSQIATDTLLVHGSPASNQDGLGPWSRDRKLDKALSLAETRLLLCAHTHRSMLRRTSSGTVVNVGSVGLPFNRDPRAQYVLLTGTPGHWEIEFRTIEYELDATLRAYRETGFDATGGVTSNLLRLELIHAAPFLVPFQKWAEILDAEHTPERVEEFLTFYDPLEPMRDFFLRLGSLLSARR